MSEMQHSAPAEAGTGKSIRERQGGVCGVKCSGCTSYSRKGKILTVRYPPCSE